MKLVGKKRLSGVLEIAMWPLMALNVAVLAFLPWIIPNLMLSNNNNPEVMNNLEFWYPRYLITLAVSGVVALLMLWQLRCLLHHVNNDTIFSLPSVQLIKCLGGELLTLSVFYIGMMAFGGMFKFSMGLLVLAFVLSGLMLFIFGEIVKQAAAYKQENDMTI